jgi:hypothetical protein
MGRFCALILVLAACGDNEHPIGTPLPPQQPVPSGGAQDPNPQPRFAPTVCGMQMWTPTVSVDPTTQLLVAPKTTGAAIMQLPASGGELTGFTVDDRMMMATTGGKVAGGFTYASATLSNVNDRLELAGTDPTDGAVRVALISADLSTQTEILKTPGTMVGPLVDPYGARVAAVADASGVTAYHFDYAWQPAGTMLVTATDAAEGITTSAYGDGMLVGWSTHEECYVARMPGFAQADFGVISQACWSPRLAGDATGTHAVLAFQYGNNILVSHITNTMLNAEPALLRPFSHSPRVINDGSRFWLSYINPHGDITVGFFDSYNRLQTIDLVGIAPQDKGYELAMINGAPWLVAVDSTNGYTATELCVTGI